MKSNDDIETVENLVDAIFDENSTIETIRYLIRRGARVNGKNETEINPLEAAISMRKAEYVDLLIKNGAKVTPEMIDLASNLKAPARSSGPIAVMEYGDIIDLLLDASEKSSCTRAKEEAKKLLSPPKLHPQTL